MTRPHVATLASSIAIAVMAAASACSSNAATTGGNGSAELLVASGDGQTAAAAAALPVPIAVVAHDASGAAVAGVTVSFSVDSGGGSIASASATSGADGVASAGSWTLGAAVGVNVITARATGYASVRFHAQALSASARPVITGGAVSTAGGTLTYSKPGDPLDGLAIAVPAAAYPVSTQWTIVADTGTHVPLPAGFSQASPLLVVSNGQGYAASPVTITVPMTLAADVAVAPFYYDPATGTLEGIPLVRRSATSATLAADHFSADLMAIPGRAGAGVRASLRAGFGDVQIVWVQSPISDLVGTFTSGFQVGVDTWEFPNIGDYLSPEGICEGMSLSEMYYYYFIGSGGRPRLYHQFDQSLANPFDNVQGIRFSGSVQEDFGAKTIAAQGQLESVGDDNGVLDLAPLQPNWIVLTLKLTHQPVLLSLHGTLNGAPIGHAVIAYAVTATGVETDVQFADPNLPATSRTMTWGAAGILIPFPFSTKQGQPPGTIETVVAIGVSAIAPITALAGRYSEFVNKQAGQDRYPSKYTIEVRDSINQVWDSLPDTVRVTVNNLHVRLRCPSCPNPLLGADPSDLQVLQVYNDSADNQLTDGTFPVNLSRGATGYVAVARAKSPNAGNSGAIGFIDSRNFTVIYGKLDILSDALHGRPMTKYAFATTPGLLATSSTKYVWSFGDTTSQTTVTGDTTITHTYPAIGTYHPWVQMFDRDGKLLGADTVTAIITRDVWQLTSAEVSSALPDGGIGKSSLDTAMQETVNEVLGSLTGAYLFRIDSTSCSAAVIELGGGTDTGLVASTRKGVFASNCGGYNGSFRMGTLGSGSLSGSVAQNVVPNSTLFTESSGSIDADMTGDTMGGTLTWTIPYSGGNGVYKIDFIANQVQPVPPPPPPGLRARRP